MSETPISAARSTPDEADAIGAFILAHPQATFCHHPGWGPVLRESYGKNLFHFTLRGKDRGLSGVIPVVALQSPLFGKQWVSLPYLDFGGPLAINPESETALIEALTRASAKEGSRLEIRSAHALASLPLPDNDKVAMYLNLGAFTEESYWKKLDARVRNQVRKAEKSGITTRWGGLDELDAFYSVFCANMRDLGSPVHARQLFSAMLSHIPGSEIGTAWREGRCIGGLVRIRFRDTLAIPWASTLAEERIYCPNHAMYYDSIKTAFREGYRRLDFGRSTKGEGTYRFKAQWLAEDSPLPWYQFDSQGHAAQSVAHVQSGKLAFAGRVWKKLPLPVANWLGPRLRSAIAA